MTNKEKVLNYIRDKLKNISDSDVLKSRNFGITAEDLSETLGISRANISHILNKLVRDKLLVKLVSRPVYYLTREKAEELIGESIGESISLNDFIALIKKANRKSSTDIFENLIGYNGSLKKQVEQAKAAILYPPYGLHTLIIGPPGSGKSYLAELMYEFGKQIGKYSNFETLNCADYYNNPQLLMSYLFGHVKGAFTGADSDNIGLVEKANNGILFLDEVHRLPPEGQEMLFYLIDKGIYHRLGDAMIRKAKLMIILATTENPESSLLKTFLRRIPIVIKMPAWNDRPFEEKIEIIKELLKKEAKQVAKKFIISPEIITIMANCDFNGNVGELKSTIQLLCAKAFLRNYNTTDSDGELKIDITLLPENMKIKMYEENTKNKKYYEDPLIILPDGKEKSLEKYDLYDFIIERYKILEQQGFDKNDINERIELYIDSLYKHIINKFKSPNVKEIEKLVDKEIIDFSAEVKDFAERKLNIKLNDNFLYAFSFHLEALIKRIKNGQPITNLRLNEIRNKYINEFKISEEIVKMIQDKFKINVSTEESGFITLFLVSGMRDINEKKSVAIMVLMHGDGVAKNIANVVNKLLNITKVAYFDMPLDMNVDDALIKIMNISKEIHEGKGILYLVDMGSLKNIPDSIEKFTGIRTRVIDNVSTPIVLEAARKAYFLDEDLDEIYNSICNRTFSNENKKRCIVTICSTGEGTADKLKNYIESNYELENLAIYSLSFFDITERTEKYYNIIRENDVLCVIGALDPEINGIPYVPTDKIIKDKNYLATNFGIKLKHNFLVENEYKEIKETLEEFLTYINPSKVIEAYKLFIKDIEKYNIALKREKKIKLGIHMGCVVERLFTNNFIKHHAKNEVINKNNGLYQILKNALTVFNTMFNININDDEICFIIDIINYDELYV
ncbi:sigma 54-interacting transcriptional regulator [Thermoanaerobacter thermocopriae]|uniref:sigma 54-interacting transcriptional regulator n=1 Tax=Thermoanaerobacter thermocopriae TaxID=29350 RepID=UPI00049023E5|nr:sigma-54-dependent transcriptional regulator [Thermoanaerobacter thermocopriae]